MTTHAKSLFLESNCHEWVKTMAETNNSAEVTITIRLLRSFQHRTVKNMVLRNVDLNQTVGELKREVLTRLPNETRLVFPFSFFFLSYSLSCLSGWPMSPTVSWLKFWCRAFWNFLLRHSVPPPFRKMAYDTLKIEHQAHGAKTNDPLINKEADESLILNDDAATLSASGVKNETTITFFKYDDYVEYKNNPSLVWWRLKLSRSLYGRQDSES